MNEKTLDALLRIATEGPSISKFPVCDAVKLWAAKKKDEYHINIFHFWYYNYDPQFSNFFSFAL